MECENVDYMTRTCLAKLDKQEIAEHVLMIKVDGINYDPEPEDVFVSNEDIFAKALSFGLNIENIEEIESAARGE